MRSRIVGLGAWWLWGLAVPAWAEPAPTVAEWVRLTTSTQATLVVGALPAWWLIRRYRRSGLIAVAIVAATMLVAQPVIKELIDRPRPTDVQVDAVGWQAGGEGSDGAGGRVEPPDLVGAIVGDVVGGPIGVRERADRRIENAADGRTSLTGAVSVAVGVQRPAEPPPSGPLAQRAPDPARSGSWSPRAVGSGSCTQRPLAPARSDLRAPRAVGSGSRTQRAPGPPRAAASQPRPRSVNPAASSDSAA